MAEQSKLKVEELRIGNYIAVDGFDPQMVALMTMYDGVYHIYHYNGVSSFHNSSPINKCAPIPISEEWLIKLGFIKTPQWKDNLTWSLEGFQYFSIDCDSMDDVCLEGYKHSFRSIRYIHELQNMVYAILGRELELKPETV
jgi:hypothetical protein